MSESIIYEVFVEMSLACQGPQQVQCVPGVPCPSMCWVGGCYPSFSSAQLSPPLLPVDINKNGQLTTSSRGPLEQRRQFFGDSERQYGVSL